jgi:hypothetical protein
MNTVFAKFSTFLCVGLLGLSSIGLACGDDAGSDGGSGAGDAGGAGGAGGGQEASAEAEFNARATGKWLLQFAVEGADGTAYVDDYDTFDGSNNQMDLFVEVFADEERTVLLLTYEASFSYEVVGRSATVTDGYDIDIQNISASMTAHVDPAAFVGFGLDDCGLVLDQAVDVSKSACGSPSFRNGSCLEKDLYQVAEGAEEMFPAAQEGDRCVTRPTASEPSLAYKLISRDLR